MAASSTKLVVGVCGGIASGKSSLCQILSDEYKFDVVNADKIGHEVLATGSVIDQIVQTFGDQVLKENERQIDRRKLGGIVFADKNKMNVLNEIMWPLIGDRIIEIVKQFKHNEENKNKVLFIEAAVLVEAKWYELGIFDEIWMTMVLKKIACSRLMKRNNLNEQEAMNRIGIQMSNQEKISILAHSRQVQKYVVIENNEGVTEFEAAIDKNVKQLGRSQQNGRPAVLGLLLFVTVAFVAKRVYFR